MSRNSYEPVIGLEVHVHLKTKTKIFCSCPNRFGDEPNTNVCPVCLALPGSLPVLKRHALELATLAALAFGGNIFSRMKFDRKNYFYPDLPKNYQISQFDMPLSIGGGVKLSNGRTIALTRIHMEEDAGKLLHTAENLDESEYTRVDLNRAGAPLIEIVSEPEIKTPDDAHEYLTNLKQILEYCGVSDCNMEEGSLRCDANISIRPIGETKLGVKVEVKNMNSFKAVRDALRHEIDRQIEAVNAGKKIVQETRLWDAGLGTTRSMRGKEESHDYRYFPDPDLVVFTLEKDFIESIRKKLPEMPKERSKRFELDYGLTQRDAGILTQHRDLADYFDEAVKLYSVGAKAIANWMLTELLRVIPEGESYSSKIKPKDFVELIKLIDEGTISGKIAKEIFSVMASTGKAPRDIVASQGLTQISDESSIEKICREVMTENPNPVEQFRAGKKNSIGFLVGAVMKKTSGKANPQLVNKIFGRLLNE